jgi:hypothetical protein
VSQVEALQAALAGEHAALYGVGVAGGKLNGAKFTAANDLFEQHRRQRDKLAALLTAAGEKPVAAEPAYDLPFAVTTPQSAANLVIQLEGRLAAVYADLVEGAEQEPVRALAIQTLITTATTQLNWGGTPVALPGAV